MVKLGQDLSRISFNECFLGVLNKLGNFVKYAEVTPCGGIEPLLVLYYVAYCKKHFI